MNKFLNIVILSLLLLPLGQVMRRPQYTNSRAVPQPSDLQWWVYGDAGTGGVSAGDAVTTWADQSGHGNDVTQATSGNKPTYQPSLLNGHAGVRFDGTNDELALSSWSTSGSSWTMFAVWTVSNTNYGVIDFNGVDGYWRFSGDGHGYWSELLSARLTAVPTTMPSSGTHYLVARATSGGTLEIYLDGSSKLSTSSFTFQSPTNIVVGNHFTLGASKACQCDIFEAGAYNVNSSTLRDNLNTYIQTTYGL